MKDLRSSDRVHAHRKKACKGFIHSALLQWSLYLYTYPTALQIATKGKKEREKTIMKWPRRRRRKADGTKELTESGVQVAG